MKKESKKIALVDFFSSGHHLNYIQLYSKILLELGYKVVACTNKPDEVKRWVKQNSPKLEKNLSTQKLEYPILYDEAKLFGGLRNKLKLWSTVNAAIENDDRMSKETTNFVFLMWLDDFIEPVSKFTENLIPLVFKYKWGGLLFQYSKYKLPQYQNKSILTGNPSDTLKLNKCKFIASLDENVAEELKDEIPNKIIVDFPDIVSNNLPENFTELDIVKKIKVKAKGRKIVTLIGSISRRKGLMTLLEASKSKELKNDYFFVFVGKPGFRNNKCLYFKKGEQLEILQTLSKYPENCFFYFDRVSDEEFDSIIKISDVIFAAYIHFFYSSNLITKASIFEKPIIVTSETLMGDRVERYNIGSTIRENNVDECIEAIQLLVNKKIEKDNFEKLSKKHSLETLKEIFKKSLDKIL